MLTHEILNGRPYTFLDDAPLEERRTRAVAIRRGIPLEAHDLSELDPMIISEVELEVTLRHATPRSSTTCFWRSGSCGQESSFVGLRRAASVRRDGSWK